ncbi:hypothetical protein SAMN02745723_102197 [Pragia fontium DSM 5563 = ATCC 49100]|uniref:Uncharacterized protein n=1 Tax=Pragia fontium DSM 5563 = ATCC 49100 TaxID=1122977 RepID=A0AAJ4W8W6_9GAMM|nr:hypothetical protein SAMN02745723_102197 [Pragia fontium DSM 5563 = ATCC 49100]
MQLDKVYSERNMIIARTWHGCVPLKYRDGFAAHLQLTGVQHS